MNYRRNKVRTKEDRRKASERAKRGWETKRLQGNDKWGSPDAEPARVKAGALLGVLAWHAVGGSVTKCVVRQGNRANGIRIGNTECGWDTLMRRVRGSLATRKVAGEPQTAAPSSSTMPETVQP